MVKVLVAIIIVVLAMLTLLGGACVCLAILVAHTYQEHRRNGE